jgi:hypothetical protein
MTDKTWCSPFSKHQLEIFDPTVDPTVDPTDEIAMETAMEIAA